MQFSGPGFILAIIAMSYLGWMITTWIRAKHGLPVENEWGGMVHKTNPQLAARNAELEAKVAEQEARIRTLEAIAIDPAARLSSDIERLR